MRFGYFHLASSPFLEIPAAQVYRQMIEQAIAADQAGFDCFWMGEHHFSSYGLNPSPLLMSVKVAAVTKRIRVGPLVLVLPFYNPLRVAEDCALADHLMDGRLNVGIGRGYQKYEFGRFGVDRKEARSRSNEIVEIMLRAWRGEPFSYQGSHYHFEELVVLPTPLQKPTPPIWMAGESADSMDFVARHGFHLITTSGLIPWERLLAARRMYEEALHRHGQSMAGKEFAVQRIVFVTHDPKEVDLLVREALYQYRVAGQFFADSERIEQGIAHPDPLPNEPSEEQVREMMIAGSPEQVIEKLQRYAEAGVTYMNCFMAVGRMPHHMVLKSIELFAEHVMPVLSTARPTGIAADRGDRSDPR